MKISFKKLQSLLNPNGFLYQFFIHQLFINLFCHSDTLSKGYILFPIDEIIQLRVNASNFLNTKWNDLTAIAFEYSWHKE